MADDRTQRPTANADGEIESSAAVKSNRTLFAIIDELQTRGSAGVTELANEIGFSKSTVHKHLTSLEEEDFVVNDGGRYRLGFRFLTIGGTLRDENDLCHQANVKAGELGNETDQMVLVSIKEEGRGIFTFVDRSRYDIKNIILGERFHLHATASGKAMLATHADEEIEEIVDDNGLTELTSSTITDKAELLERIGVIRERGYALNLEERQRGIRAVSAATTHPETGMACAMTVAGPANRLPKQELEGTYANAVLGAVNELELEMRY
ncbi:IclR family transcriptional regulator [Natrialbaceae archaeon AArc-T1-2]|uniref:IclR family transcriptional regulator n=1 Tax=Natrialbaceae archaeon AArc-T1-2 TaxID=3053904 RepID=UPI00255AC64A|nr:IclR family transcriptional regulator [Natrialbaceae archaeon AArc-T1-2]WIV68172.1 IclR family transcriptional regulator [Natrialbaceae archaeon AArc-T1-2]